MTSAAKTRPDSAERMHRSRDAALADGLLDVRQAAALLGVKPGTLYTWAYLRKVPHVKLFNKALRFRRSDLDRLIADSVRPALGSSRD